MARKPSLKQTIERLIAKQEPAIAKAFMDAIKDITDRVQLKAIVDSLELGDINAALRAFNLEVSAFRTLERAIQQAYEEAGVAIMGALPTFKDERDARIVVRFDVRNLRAEAQLAQHSSNLITRILEDQRAAIRERLTEGLVAGQNPRSTALDIVGRVNAATGRREGGLIGLTQQQSRAVARAREELSSVETLSDYLQRQRRDKRFDRTIAKAIKTGTVPDAATRDKIVGRYSDSLLQLRGETIARTETMEAINTAQTEAWRQMNEAGAIPLEELRKVWVATRDSRTRDSHRYLNGVAVGLDERFSNGLMHPGDTSGPASEVINCRCTMVIRVMEGA